MVIANEGKCASNTFLFLVSMLVQMHPFTSIPNCPLLLTCVLSGSFVILSADKNQRSVKMKGKD